MFDAEGNYSPPDQPTRFVHVLTKDGKASLGRDPALGHQAPVKIGQVTKFEMMGQTNVAGTRVMNLHGGVWVEHETAQIGEVLTESELSDLVASATKRQAAVRVYQERERIDGPARAAKAAADKATADEAALDAKIEARVKAALAAAAKPTT